MTFKSLPKEVLEKIKEFHCPPVHPTAQIIKGLVFDRDENGERGIHNDVHASLYVSGDVFLKQRYTFFYFMEPDGYIEDSRRRYIFADFMEPDRYIEDSLRNSNIAVGRVQDDREEQIHWMIAFYEEFTYGDVDIRDRPLS